MGGFAISKDLLRGSWVVISGVISPLIWVITIVTLLITPLITTHEPPSRVCGSGGRGGTRPISTSRRDMDTRRGLGFRVFWSVGR